MLSFAAKFVATGKNVTAIFVTHAHGDHFFGAPAVLERFPDATVVAAPSVAARMDAQYGPRWLDGFWNPRFPGQISAPARSAKNTTCTPHSYPHRQRAHVRLMMISRSRIDSESRLLSSQLPQQSW